MRPQMIGAYCLYFATCYAYYLTDTWLPNFLSTERGFEGATIGLASSMVFFAAIPGALFFSRIADKFAHKKISLIIFLELVAAAMLFIAVQAPDKTFLMIGLIYYGFFGKLAVEPPHHSLVGDAAEEGNSDNIRLFQLLRNELICHRTIFDRRHLGCHRF